MKKEFEPVKVIVIEFQEEDVIATSETPME